ncbi:MAG: hypothetical protein ACI8QZ_000320 [Chlamydiales bacterium]|jgi:hypothetical protein
MTTETGATVLYCHCAYAKVLPKEVRDEVLTGLTESGVAFEAVPDLCEMAARKDPTLARVAACGDLKIAACFPRAVTWLFHGAGTPLPETGVEILNMRTRAAGEIVERALAPDIQQAPIVEPEDELAELARASGEPEAGDETQTEAKL